MTLLILFVLATGACALMGFYRLLIGPSQTDRVVGLDILFSVAIVLSLIAAQISERTLYLDVAIGLSLMGFASTLAWSRLIQNECSNKKETQR